MVFSGFFDEPKRARPKFSQREKELHYKDQGGKCNGCGKKFEIRNMAVDHIRPFSRGGGERGNNIQLLCTACNSLKGAGTMSELKKKLRTQGVIKSATTDKPAPTAKKGTTSKPKTTKRPAAKKRQTRQSDPFADLFRF